jgi:hypothetical protein
LPIYDTDEFTNSSFYHLDRQGGRFPTTSP